MNEGENFVYEQLSLKEMIHFYWKVLSLYVTRNTYNFCLIPFGVIYLIFSLINLLDSSKSFFIVGSFSFSLGFIKLISDIGSFRIKVFESLVKEIHDGILYRYTIFDRLILTDVVQYNVKSVVSSFEYFEDLRLRNFYNYPLYYSTKDLRNMTINSILNEIS